MRSTLWFSLFCLSFICLSCQAHSLLVNSSEVLPESRTLFDDELREFVEFLRLQMQCGYPPKGIPPLAPLKVAFKSIDSNPGEWLFRGNFTDLTIDGLDKFEMSVLKWSNIWHTITFDMNFDSLHIYSSAYQMEIFSKLLRIFGDGAFNLELTNLRVHGSFILRPTTASSGIYVKNFKVKYELGDVKSNTTGIVNSLFVTKMINKWIEEFLRLLINDNPSEVSEFMESLLVPPMNAVLEHVAWYEITAIILGLAEGVLPVEPIC